MTTTHLIRKAYRYRLRGNSTLEAALRRWEGCCRKVWNLALAEQQARRERGEKYANYIAMAKWLTAWRCDPQTAYLAVPPVHVLQNVLRSLDAAYLRFFKKTGGYPKYKRYGDACGIRETDVKCFAVDSANGRIKLPKLGYLRYRKSQEIEGTPKAVTVRREPEGWYLSIQVEICLAAQSLHRLRRYQRAVARKIEAAKVRAGIPKDQPFPKGFRLQSSHRLRKAQARVARIHQKIHCQRTDFLHKLSTEIADHHAAFCIEDLKVRGPS